MRMEKEDYLEPACPLCGRPVEAEAAMPVPVDRIQRKLWEYEDASDWAGAERHLQYWLSEAEMNRDQRGALMLHNELMGFYRKQGKKENALSHAEAAIRSGRFDASNCEPETFGPGGFESPAALLDWLKNNLPPQDRVVTHGDFCLPNLFTDGRRFTGFIDVGNTGAGDRWADLALGWRSLKHNSDGHYGHVYPDIDPDDLFRAAGVPKDGEKLRYYILLDELN